MRGSVRWIRYLVFRLSLSLVSGCLGPASVPDLPVLDVARASVVKHTDTLTQHHPERRWPISV